MITQANNDRLHVRASDWLTAINVGLNELDLQLGQQHTVSYKVRYWRWATYVLGLCGVLGLTGLALLLILDVRSYLTRSPQRMLPGLTLDQNLIVAWGLLLFWGFVWPWVLIVLHKPALRRLTIRLITEVDAQGTLPPP